VGKYRQNIGQMGEKIAINYLKNLGFTVLQHHFTCHWGELDIVAGKGEILHFVEVKTRVGERMGKPYEAMTYFKRLKLRRTINVYLTTSKVGQWKFYLDVVSIILNSDFTLRKLQFFEAI
jgi:putative endonuclease